MNVFVPNARNPEFWTGRDADIVTQITSWRIQKTPRFPFIWISHPRGQNLT